MREVDFEWDVQKDFVNRDKHGISFFEAQQAFLDKDRVIAEDLNHGSEEKRFYCFGRVKNEIITVRFIYRDKKIRIIGAGYWRKGKKFMSKPKKIKYSNEPVGKIHIIPDFLPDPKNLVLKEEVVKVTLSLTKESIDFFKEEASLHHTQYQKMIRILLDQYAAHYRQRHKDRKYK